VDRINIEAVDKLEDFDMRKSLFLALKLQLKFGFSPRTIKPDMHSSPTIKPGQLGWFQRWFSVYMYFLKIIKIIGKSLKFINNSF
jgi:hypothetical protein